MMNIAVQPQRKMNGYNILQTLGKGGFSKVKLGIHESTKERVGLKLLVKDKLSSNSSIQKQVEKELTAMSKISHENVIRLKAVDWNAIYPKKSGKKIDVILVVLELATGGELFDYLSYSGAFDELIARYYFKSLIDGVSYCHSVGVVHRDLKPENVLLDDNFTLKIADFGFSQSFADGVEKIMYTECGTPGYMAPEMFKRTGYEGTSADVWACGVILFIMLASFPPFQRPSMNDWWFNKLSTQRHSLFWEAHCRSAYFSEAAKDLINKMLTVDPSKRITMDQIKKHSFFNGATATPTALFTEFSRRKAIVDANKFREKAEKKKTEAGVGGAMGGVEGAGFDADGDVAMDRGENDGINPESETLPSAPPSKLAVDLFINTPAHVSTKANATTTTNTTAGSSFDDDNSLASCLSTTLGISSSSSSSSTSSSSPSPSLFDPSIVIDSFSNFSVTSSSPSTIIEKLTSILKALKLSHTYKNNDYKFKCTFVGREGTLQFNIQVFAVNNNNTNNTNHNEYMIVFRRTSGAGIYFRKLFAEIRAQLSDLLIVPSSSSSASASASSTTEDNHKSSTINSALMSAAISSLGGNDDGGF